MQQIDFFSRQWHQETTSAGRFFIYDEGGDGDMAHSTTDPTFASRSVDVSNTLRKTVLLIPVDHNIDIKKEGTDDTESTCDYIFTVDSVDEIVFGEIKNRSKGWINDGIQQLENTIAIFKANHDITQWNKKFAFVSNYRFPKHRECTIVREDKFRDDHAIRLLIQNNIAID